MGVVVSDGSWQATLPQRALRGVWAKAMVIGDVGAPELPWGKRITPKDFIEGGTGGSVGSASRIFWELFTKRGTLASSASMTSTPSSRSPPAGWRSATSCY